MRAGLLSQPQVIQKINELFVSTTITYYDLMEIANKGNKFAAHAAANWSNPVTLMFLSSEGRFISKLDVLNELNVIHPDTTFRPGQERSGDPEANTQVFLKHVEKHFGKTR